LASNLYLYITLKATKKKEQDKMKQIIIMVQSN